jgi:hypothetical protein
MLYLVNDSQQGLLVRMVGFIYSSLNCIELHVGKESSCKGARIWQDGACSPLSCASVLACIAWSK